MTGITNFSFEEYKKSLFKAPFLKRFLIMLLAVITMGICVSILKLTRFGVDPFSAVCYGLHDLTGISFGTIELLFNGSMLIIVLFFNLDRVGFGTLGNTILVGYAADFTTYILKNMGITYIESFVVRLLVMLVVLSIFILAVSFYINAGLGASAYDVLPYTIHHAVTLLSGKDIKFRYIRMIFDAVFTLTGFLIHGQSGLITVLIVLALGPMIDAVSKFLAKFLNMDN